jgi:hypothetical protein
LNITILQVVEARLDDDTHINADIISVVKGGTQLGKQVQIVFDFDRYE